MKRISISVLLVITSASMAMAQSGGVSATPPPQPCEYDGSGGNETLRLVSGKEAAPYFFSCQTHNPNAGPSGCVQSTLPAGSMINVKSELGGWSCIHSEGFVSGWIPSARLEPLPSVPKPPVADWLGWWRNGPDAPGIKNDRILITRGEQPNSLHVSGRGYWYGLNGNVHFGGFTGDAVPVGPRLHIVDGCVVELELSRNDQGLKLLANDNERCGGMNVRFMGTWRKFQPKSPGRKRASRQ